MPSKIYYFHRIEIYYLKQELNQDLHALINFYPKKQSCVPAPKTQSLYKYNRQQTKIKRSTKNFDLFQWKHFVYPKQ
jgi:hypothetical protein